MSHRVLIIDDDPTLVEMLIFVLSRGGYETRAATNGADALEILKSTHIDAIVLDVMLPDVDGYQICRNIRALPGIADIPILMLSARSQVEYRLTGFESGADDYVPKPADPKEVLARIHALIARAERAQVAPSPVIGLVGVKGGVGTTTLLINTALALVEDKKRVCLMELSDHGYDGAWRLGMGTGQPLIELNIPASGRVTPAAIQSCIIKHNSGIHYMPLCTQQPDKRSFAEGVLTKTIETLQTSYDIILLDVPPSALALYPELITTVGAFIPVAERDDLCIWHLSAFVRWLQDQHANVPGSVLVDRTIEPSRDSASSTASKIGLAVLALIPPMPLAMFHADNLQTPLYMSDSTNLASEAYAEFATRLITDPIEGPADMRP